VLNLHVTDLQDRIEDMQRSERWIARIAGEDYNEEEKPPVVHRLGIGSVTKFGIGLC
jgi:hypothetical protein